MTLDHVEETRLFICKRPVSKDYEYSKKIFAGNGNNDCLLLYYLSLKLLILGIILCLKTPHGGCKFGKRNYYDYIVIDHHQSSLLML
jgi:hypothetical protein